MGTFIGIFYFEVLVTSCDISAYFQLIQVYMLKIQHYYGNFRALIIFPKVYFMIFNFIYKDNENHKYLGTDGEYLSIWILFTVVFFTQRLEWK